MKTIHIAEPIWKTRSVGLNVENMSPDDEVIIEIMYIEKKSGRRTYPGKYKMLVKNILNYPQQTLQRGVKVHIVPISSLDVEDSKKDSEELTLF